MCLGAILNQQQMVTCCDKRQALQIRWLSIQVNRNDGPGFWRDGGFGGTRVDGEGRGIDVNQDGSRACLFYSTHGCGCRVRYRNYLVSWPNASGSEGEFNGIGAI